MSTGKAGLAQSRGGAEEVHVTPNSAPKGEGRRVIVLPAPTLERVVRLLEQRQQADALIEATLLATREALGVPAEWVLRDLKVGFEQPETSGTEPAG